MCRNIRILYNFEPPTSADEIHSAALQYVRKVSGMQKPSRANETAFETAPVEEVSVATARLLRELSPRPRPATAGRGGTPPGPGGVAVAGHRRRGEADADSNRGPSLQ